jgi:predicted ArsR family transcriptional regulator
MTEKSFFSHSPIPFPNVQDRLLLFFLYHILSSKSRNFLTYLTKESLADIVTAAKEARETMVPWKQHFFTSTRGRIILLLRRASRTVDELARELGLTDNAVRSHLLTLERDGLVCQAGTRRGSGKPALLYAVTSASEQLFPHAYTSVLRALMAVLNEKIALDQRVVLMQQVGRHLAGPEPALPDELSDRLRHAIALFDDLGGLADLAENAEQYLIQGHHCPFAELVPTYPEVCHVAQTLLMELSGKPVEVHCEQNEPVRCCFTVTKA